jgi:hypothetical protein
MYLLYSFLNMVYLATWIGKLYNSFTVQLPEYGFICLPGQASCIMYLLYSCLNTGLPVYMESQAVQCIYCTAA